MVNFYLFLKESTTVDLLHLKLFKILCFNFVQGQILIISKELNGAGLSHLLLLSVRLFL